MYITDGIEVFPTCYIKINLNFISFVVNNKKKYNKKDNSAVTIIGIVSVLV